MTEYNIINIREVVYSTRDLAKASQLFEEYGGWNRVGKYQTDRYVLDAWNLNKETSATEILIQSNHFEHGQLRLIAFKNTDQDIIRSSQQPWDVGGIMDINLRVHDVQQNFDTLRNMGWHGLSDPLLQVMGPFKLYDVLMRGLDDTIIAFTHRLEPPMELTAPINLPTHVYKTSITVENLQESRLFYEDILGCEILTEYAVKKDSPQENMFGLPHNLADKVTCNAIIYSIHGGRDVDFQIVQFDGVTGKDYRERVKAPNIGFLNYRVELTGIKQYHEKVKKAGGKPTAISQVVIEPYGEVLQFSISSPCHAHFEFFESTSS